MAQVKADKRVQRRHAWQGNVLRDPGITQRLQRLSVRDDVGHRNAEPDELTVFLHQLSQQVVLQVESAEQRQLVVGQLVANAE